MIEAGNDIRQGHSAKEDSLRSTAREDGPLQGSNNA